MSIYTKTGDCGKTSLYGGKRVLKSDFQIEAYGTIDELTSFIGFVITKIRNKKDIIFLNSIQKDLYIIMSFLSGKENNLILLKNKIKEFENKIDYLEKKLPKLSHFIIPGGTQISACFHILRTICRRSERVVIKYFKTYQLPVTRLRQGFDGQANNQLLITKYINRLSDLFFVFARFYNRRREVVV